MNMIKSIFTPERISQLILSAIVVAVAVVIWIIVTRILKRVRRERSDIFKKDGRIGTLTSVTLNIIKAIMILIVIMIVLEINGVRITSLVAGLGIAGAIVGLALQDYLKDVIMGAHLITGEFFHVGDVVRYGTFEGSVESFSLRATKLRSIDDGSVMTISNRNISEILKLPASVDLALPIAYGEDLQKTEELLKGLAKKLTLLDDIKDCAYLGPVSLLDSSITYKLRLDIEPAAKLRARRLALAEALSYLALHGIEIPFNQLDIHVKEARS